MQSVLARLLLALGLFAVIGWPALAIALSAVKEIGDSAGPSAAGVDQPLRLARSSIELVAATEAIALPVGTLLALLLLRTDLWGRRALLALIGVALFVPMPLHATAWLGAFGNQGRSQAIGSRPILVGLPGAAVVHGLAAIPWVVLLVGVGLRAVEAKLEETAQLDMPAWRVIISVTLRRAIGAVGAAALAVAVLTAGDMTVTDLLQVRSYAEEAYLLSQLGLSQGALAVRVVLPPLMVLGSLVLLGSAWLAASDPAKLTGARLHPKVWRLGFWRRPLGVVALVTMGNLFALPFYGLVWRAGRVGRATTPGLGPSWSLHGLVGTLKSAAPEVAGPLLRSILWAGVGATACVLIAWPLAWLARRQSAWRWVAGLALALVLATPGPVAGLALVMAYDAPYPPSGAPLWIRTLFRLRVLIYDSPAPLVMAYAMRTLPYALLVLWPALRALPKAYLDAASLDGCNEWEGVRRVALPLSRGALAAAWGVAFVLAVGELPAALPTDRPSFTPLLTARIWSLLHTGVESHLAGVALVALAVVAAIGLAVAWAVGRVYTLDPRPEKP